MDDADSATEEVAQGLDSEPCRRFWALCEYDGQKYTILARHIYASERLATAAQGYRGLDPDLYQVRPVDVCLV